jgi:outer membrane protein assembly factor BamA
VKARILSLFILLSINVFSQDTILVNEQDSIVESIDLPTNDYSATATTKSKKPKKLKKTGWNFGFLPVISYNTDMGLQYGGLINLFDYGDSAYPVYEQMFYAEVSRYTKGSGNNRLYWDTKKLIPKIRMMMDLTYITDRAIPLFGYNGYESAYHPEWTKETLKVNGEKVDNKDFVSRMFYNYSRSFLRFNTDFSWKIGYPKISYFAGFNIMWFKAGRVNFEKLDQRDTTTLYDNYVDWGIITPTEVKASKKGGIWTTHLRLGANFDSRDHERTPSKGILAEVVFDFAPAFMSNMRADGFENGYATFSASFKHFVPLWRDNIVMVYRLGVQQKIFGRIPFFLSQNLNYIWLNRIVNEGVGGATTVRGILKNSVIGDGVAYANLEFRGKLVDFTLVKQNWSIYLNAFCDAGMVYDKHPLNPRDHSILEDPNFFDQSYFGRVDGVHTSAGFGIGIVMNRNFIISADYGFPFNKKDGKGGFYMGINFVL